MKSRPKAIGTTYGPYAGMPNVGGGQPTYGGRLPVGADHVILDGVQYRIPEGASALFAGVASAPKVPSGSITTLWVGSLQPSVTQDDLFDSFQKYGFVTDVKITAVQSATQYEAHVKFMLRDEANQALSASLNRKLLVKGKNVTCRWAQQDLVNAPVVQMPKTSTAGLLTPSSSANEGGAATIWLGNLPEACTEAEVRGAAAFLGGSIADVVLFSKNSTGSGEPNPYGSGLVRFGNAIEADAFLRSVASRLVKIRGTVLNARVHDPKTRVPA